MAAKPCHNDLPYSNRDPQAMKVPENPHQPRTTDSDILRNDEPMLKQVKAHCVSQEQSPVYGLKKACAGLRMLESKCTEIHIGKYTPTDDKQWEALVRLHRFLLNEYYDFLLASQHPAVSTPFPDLATKYQIPGRIWTYGIYRFLELLRRHLPYSMDHMLSFIYFSFTTVTLFYEATPTLRHIWTENLGDLGRYRHV